MVNQQLNYRLSIGNYWQSIRNICCPDLEQIRLQNKDGQHMQVYLSAKCKQLP